MNINKDSDFKIHEEFAIEVPFKFTYYTAYGISLGVSHVASYSGKEFVGCVPEPDGILVPFDNHHLGVGSVMVRREFFLTDSDYADGVCNTVRRDETGVVLVSGKSDIGDITTTVYPNYQKGDPFTYDDFTPEQLAGLKGEKGDSGTTELMSFEIADGELYASIPEESNIEFSINKSGELIAIWD